MQQDRGKSSNGQKPVAETGAFLRAFDSSLEYLPATISQPM